MRTYVRPLGLMPQQRVDRSIAASQTSEGGPIFTGALPLAGDGPLDFTAIELIRRDAQSVTRRVMTLDALWQSDIHEQAATLSASLGQITSSRRRLAGMPWHRPLIMGIVNVTPDSFSDGGRYDTTQSAIEHGLKLIADGADLLDIGAESTRPGSDPTPADEELARVMPVIAGLHAATDRPISIDTRKAVVMERAVAAGASMINDVSALGHDPESITVAAELGVPIILMHALGDPKTMQTDPRYVDVTTEIFDYLEARIDVCMAAGIPREKLIVDPGIGFGKTLAHNLQIMSELALLHGLGCPVLVGASRKSFIGRLTNQPIAADRVPGSIAAALAGAAQGAQILRVHDVAETKAALAIWMAATSGRPPTR